MTEKHKSKQEVIEAIESFYNDKELPVAKTRAGLKALKKRIEDLLEALHAEHPDPEVGVSSQDGDPAKTAA